MCCGAKVEIEDSKISVLDDPRTRYCPLSSSLYGFEEIDRSVVKKIIETKINKRGFTTSKRTFTVEVLVPFGASEVIMSCLEEGLFDCAVTVCEGAGTVLASNPKLVQMIGAFLTGIVETTPVPEIIEKLKEYGAIILDEKKASIDQVEGVKLAAQRGCKRIAVTIAGFRSWEIAAIRDLELNMNVDVTVLTVCTTRCEERDVENLMLSDLVWGCNSKIVRENVASKAIFQLGVSIPVFALTVKGKRALLSHIMKLRDPLVAFRAKMPYLVSEKLPR